MQDRHQTLYTCLHSMHTRVSDLKPNNLQHLMITIPTPGPDSELLQQAGLQWYHEQLLPRDPDTKLAEPVR